MLAGHALFVKNGRLCVFAGQLSLEDLDLRHDLAPLALKLAAAPLHFLLPNEECGLVPGFLGKPRRAGYYAFWSDVRRAQLDAVG